MWFHWERTGGNERVMRDLQAVKQLRARVGKSVPCEALLCREPRGPLSRAQGRVALMEFQWCPCQLLHPGGAWGALGRAMWVPRWAGRSTGLQPSSACCPSPWDVSTLILESLRALCGRGEGVPGVPASTISPFHTSAQLPCQGPAGRIHPKVQKLGLCSS